MAKVPFPKKLHPFQSLSFRVILVALCLLVVPLFLHTFFIYQSEYHDRVKELHRDLGVIGNFFRTYLVSEIDMDWKLIEAAGAPGQFGIMGIDADNETAQKFTRLNPRTQALDVVAKTESGTILAIPIPYSQILGQLIHLENFPYPVSLVLKEGDIVLAGTFPPGPISEAFSVPDTMLTLVLSVPSDAIRGIHQRWVIRHALSLICTIGLVGGLLVSLLTRRVARPLRSLCHTLQRVSEGAIHTRYTPDRMGFEINELGKQCNRTLDALLLQQGIAERERIAREKLAEELRIGHTIQQSLFPTQLPALSHLDLATSYLPAKEVGGDFYDLFLLEGGTLFLTIADTAGKGISACLYSLGLRSALRSLLSMTNNLAEAVMRANDLFCLDAQQSGMFVTLWAALYDPVRRKLTYCNQGHPPAILVRGGHLQELTTGGIALGAQKLDSVATQDITLEEGDLLFLYTDGIIEAHDPDQHLFGTKRLREFLARQQKNRPQILTQNLLEEIHLFSHGTPQHDDLTAVALRVIKT